MQSFGKRWCDASRQLGKTGDSVTEPSAGRRAATRCSRGGTLSRERTAHEMSAPTTTSEQPQRIEDSTIQPIPDAERHGKARDLFTIWFGSNIMMLTIVTGALATTV